MNSLDPPIRAMSFDDIGNVVLIHEQAFPGFFITLLGQPFIRSYYLTVLEYKNSITLVHLDSDRNIIGFAVGFINPENFYSFLKRQVGRFFFPTLIGFFRRPYLIKKIVLNIVRVNKVKLKSEQKLFCDLSSIGVGKQGVGIGKALLSQFIEAAIRKGVDKIQLDTDLSDNQKVIEFYKVSGFVEAGIETRGDRKMIHLSLSLNQQP